MVKGNWVIRQEGKLAKGQTVLTHRKTRIDTDKNQLSLLGWKRMTHASSIYSYTGELMSICGRHSTQIGFVYIIVH